MADKKSNIASKVRAAVEETVIGAGYKLWDVTYYKEGPEMILEIAIDKDGGISINDCAEVTRLIEPIIDELDPIEESYCLQVASAGTVRNLTKDEHISFAKESGLKVLIGLFTAVDGKKEFEGVITDFDGETLKMVSDGKEYNFNKKQITKINAEFEAEADGENEGDEDEQGTV